MADTPPAVRALEAIIARAERRRRRTSAWRAISDSAPIAGAGALAAALALRLLGWPSLATLAATGLGLILGLAWVAGRLLWPRRVDDPEVWQLDIDAHLSGELRSAFWFARAGHVSDWAAFHLTACADRVGAVPWPDVYPFARTARRWAATAGLVVGVIAIGSWPGLDGVASVGEAAEATDASGNLPEELIEGLRALGSGDLTFEEMQALAQALLEVDPDRLDPELRRQLESIAAASQPGQSPSPGDGTQDGAEGQQAGAESGAPADVPDDIQWALGETASRLANENARQGDAPPQSDDTGAAEGTEPPDADQPAGASAGEQNDRTPSRDAEDSNGVGGLAMETEEGAAEETSKGEGRSSAGSGRTPRGESLMADWARDQALDREIVQANEAARGRNIQVDERHRTNARQSTLAFSGQTPREAFETPAVEASVVVPEARRALVRRYFAREAQ